MRGNVVTTANKSVMLHHLSVTRQSREKFVKNAPLETIISRYPILLTMNEAVGIFFQQFPMTDKVFFLHLYSRFQVEEEFECLTERPLREFIEKWNSIEAKLLEEAERNLTSPAVQSIILKAKEASEEYRNFYLRLVFKVNYKLIYQVMTSAQCWYQSYYFTFFRTKITKRW